MNENEILSTIRELKARMDELSARLANVEAGCSTVAPLEITEPIDIMEGLSVSPGPEPEAIPEDTPLIVPEAKVEEKKSEKKPEKKEYCWRTAKPLPPVSNILSGISLRDRGAFINTLFKEDPQAFVSTINRFNDMASLEEAEEYIVDNFHDWNLNSEIVKRLMMAVRRKLN